MNPLALVFFLVVATALLAVPRKWAPVPLLVGCCYMTLGQGIEIGSISLPIFRMLILTGIVRSIARGERLASPLNVIDKLVLALGGWIVFASFFHNGQLGSGPTWASGLVFNLLGSYFLIRVWSVDREHVAGIVIVVAFLLAPIALEMLSEKITRVNQFSIFGGVSHTVDLREGKLRAQGPFGSPILAGTVGAACLPLFIGILRRNRFAGIVGIVSALVMAKTCASSGPILSALAGVGAVCLWKFRHLTGSVRLAAVLVYFAYGILTGEPGFYIMKRLDVTGGSTGWFRARLIDSAIQNMGEWWAFGTDYTRHWMATGVSFSPFHTDITNYYLSFCVNAGLLGVALVIAILVFAFKWVGKICNEEVARDDGDAFFVWCLGGGLFAHAATSVSVSYFDQSVIFFWMNVAVISGVYSWQLARVSEQTPEERESDDAMTHASPLAAMGSRVLAQDILNANGYPRIPESQELGR